MYWLWVMSIDGEGFRNYLEELNEKEKIHYYFLKGFDRKLNKLKLSYSRKTTGYEGLDEEQEEKEEK